MVEPDRRSAIAMAIRYSRPGDVVLISGKGDQTVQQVNGDAMPFDDRVVVRQLLEASSGRRLVGHLPRNWLASPRVGWAPR